jgi:aminoglycoside 3-N-acetyltransferase
MLNRHDIADCLRGLGLHEGDIVLLHSSFLSLGPVKNGPDEVIAGFREAIGETGTLLVPAFGKLGILVEKVKELPGAIISSCPCAAVAAVGPAAAELCADHWQADIAHGENTPYTRLAAKGGYVCLLGCDQDRNTSLHSVEAMLHLPYLRTRTCDNIVTPDGSTVSHSYRFFPGPHRDFIGVDAFLRDCGAMKTATLGKAQVRLIKSQVMLDTLMEYGRHNPDLFLCENPECADCTRQRADLARADFARESFQLCCASSLAGRYVPEMCENLAKAGINALELDTIQGKLISMLTPERLAAAAAELREAGIAISGLRLATVPDDIQVAIALAQAAGVNRVILPLPVGAEALLVLGRADLDICLANVTQTSLAAAASVAEAKRLCPKTTACFNATNFARIGENPFLRSFKAGHFLKTIGQLDVGDCTWIGRPTTLAGGNAEIKELISILRCSNFSGWLCLGGGAAYPGTLQEAAAELRWLLQTM